ESSGKLFLVLELAEGETLADRISRGPVPLDEALVIARQIADALEAAYEKGIVHRDLKPANVKISPDGEVKLLDFGLAKAWVDGESSSPDVSNSPTITHMATEFGVILGTAAYMSPEQARGKAVDRRTDIWAFGVLLYEMLSGKRLFYGESVSDVLASVLKTDPDLSALPAEMPSSIRKLIQRCLERDPRRRLRDIGEARIAIEDYLANPHEKDAPISAPSVPAKSRTVLPWIVAGLFGLVAAAVISYSLYRVRHERPDTPTAFAVSLPAGEIVPPDEGPVVALSPDGSTLAY